MVASCFPLQYLIAALGLWLNRQQQDVIDSLKEENQLLKAKLGGRNIHFTDAERCRLALRAKALGRKLLSQLDWPPQKLASRNFLGRDDRSRNIRHQRILVMQSTEHGFRTYDRTLSQSMAEV